MPRSRSVAARSATENRFRAVDLTGNSQEKHAMLHQKAKGKSAGRKSPAAGDRRTRRQRAITHERPEHT